MLEEPVEFQENRFGILVAGEEKGVVLLGQPGGKGDDPNLLGSHLAQAVPARLRVKQPEVSLKVIEAGSLPVPLELEGHKPALQEGGRIADGEPEGRLEAVPLVHVHDEVDQELDHELQALVVAEQFRLGVLHLQLEGHDRAPEPVHEHVDRLADHCPQPERDLAQGPLLHAQQVLQLLRHQLHVVVLVADLRQLLLQQLLVHCVLVLLVEAAVDQEHQLAEVVQEFCHCQLLLVGLAVGLEAQQHSATVLQRADQVFAGLAFWPVPHLEGSALGLPAFDHLAHHIPEPRPVLLRNYLQQAALLREIPKQRLRLLITFSCKKIPRASHLSQQHRLLSQAHPQRAIQLPLQSILLALDSPLQVHSQGQHLRRQCQLHPALSSVAAEQQWGQG